VAIFRISSSLQDSIDSPFDKTSFDDEKDLCLPEACC